MAHLVDKGGQRLGVGQGATGAVPFVAALGWQQKHHRPLSLGQLGTEDARKVAALVGGLHDAGQEPVMGMGRGVLERLGQGLPADEVDEVIAADRHDLRDALGPRIFHPVGACADGRAEKMVGHLLRGEIHHGGEGPFGGEGFKGTPAHAGGVKHRHLIAARLERGFERGHIAQDRLAE